MRRSRLLATLAVLLACLFTLPATAGATELAPAPLGSGSLLFNPTTSARCTAAFAAKSGTTGYLITGPGCASPGLTLYSGNNVVVGPVVATPFPQGGHSIVRVTNTAAWVLVPWINTPSGRIVIRGSRETPVGGTVCLLGRVSGWHCGIITAKNITVTFPWGTVTGLTRTTVCVEPGDAGAAFLTGDQAQGVLFGGTGNCRTGGVSYFKPINPILAPYGLTLLTG
jgi:hypothetical protein